MLHWEPMKPTLIWFLVCLGRLSVLGASPILEPEIVLVPGNGISIVTPIYKPAGPGPFPVVLFSHGRAPSAEDRAKPHLPPPGLVRFWLARGVAVVAPVRIGYGQTGGPNREDSGLRWDSAGQPQGVPDFSTVADRAAECDLTVLEWLRAQPWVQPQKLILVGQSVGGMTTIKLGSLNLPGVVGLVNFAGGAGGNPALSPGRSAFPSKMTDLYRGYGTLVKVPSLWLYAENDLFWGPDVPGDWFRAFAAGGSPAQFVHTPAVPGHNGHFLVSYGEGFWRKPLEAFAQSLGL